MIFVYKKYFLHALFNVGFWFYFISNPTEFRMGGRLCSSTQILDFRP